MKLEDVSEKTNIALSALEHAAMQLDIGQDATLGPSDIARLHMYLKAHGGASAESLATLSAFAVEPAIQPIDKRNIVIPSGPGKAPVRKLAPDAGGNLGALLGARLGPNSKVAHQRKSRNCGDTAGVVVHGIECQSVKRDIGRGDFVKALSVDATAHEIWQATIHQHTFSIERHPEQGNRIIQSYQASCGTYDVFWWCGIAGYESYCDKEAESTCGALRTAWQRPDNRALQNLGQMIDALYAAEKGPARAEAWRKLPFHPGDDGLVLRDTETLAFTAERFTLLTDSAFPAAYDAVTKQLSELKTAHQ